jgi:hypothetical protein
MTRLSEYLKCPSCNKEPDPERLAMIITESSPYTYNITHFDPNDPVILSETEIYCSTDCCVRAVTKEEIGYD